MFSFLVWQELNLKNLCLHLKKHIGSGRQIREAFTFLRVKGKSKSRIVAKNQLKFSWLSTFVDEGCCTQHTQQYGPIQRSGWEEEEEKRGG